MNPIVSADSLTFEEFQDISSLSPQPCVKTAITYAVQINTPFRVKSMEGNYKQGKPGDYLMRGVKGELYICDKDVYEKTYATLRSKVVMDAYVNFLQELAKDTPIVGP